MPAVSKALRRTFATILVIQGFHFVEHIIQLIQIKAFGVPEDQALGVLGAVFAFHGTEEWLHLAFNLSLLTAVLWIQPAVRDAIADRARYLAFLGLAAGLELWHVIEHLVVTGNMIANGGGCPCLGILDRFIPDTTLHLGYNTLALAGLVAVAGPLLRRLPAPASIAATIGRDPAWLARRESDSHRLAG